MGKRFLLYIVSAFIMFFPAKMVIADADITPPEVDGSKLTKVMPEGKDSLAPGDAATLSVKITDESELRFASLYYRNKDNGKDRNILLAKKEGTEDIWEATFEVDEQTAPGMWQIFYILTKDIYDNEAYLYNSCMINMTPSYDMTAVDIIVAGTSLDNTPPVIDPDSLMATLPEGRDFAVSAGGAKISVAISDEGVGISQADAIYIQPISGEELHLQLNYQEESQKWEKEISLNGTNEFGTWKLYKIEARDKAGNRTEITNSELDPESTADLSAGSFFVRCTVAFQTSGGSSIDPQYVVSGGNAVKPENPTMGDGAWQGGGDFVGWYADEAFAQEFNFNLCKRGFSILLGWR